MSKKQPPKLMAEIFHRLTQLQKKEIAWMCGNYQRFSFPISEGILGTIEIETVVKKFETPPSSNWAYEIAECLQFIKDNKKPPPGRFIDNDFVFGPTTITPEF